MFQLPWLTPEIDLLKFSPSPQIIIPRLIVFPTIQIDPIKDGRVQGCCGSSWRNNYQLGSPRRMACSSGHLRKFIIFPQHFLLMQVYMLLDMAIDRFWDRIYHRCWISCLCVGWKSCDGEVARRPISVSVQVRLQHRSSDALLVYVH